MSTLPKAVLRALERGWSVIPVGLDKRPLIKSWKPYQQRPATLEEVAAWHRDLKPPAWAVISGAVSGIVIVDFDGEAGAHTLEALPLRKNVRTGGGGFHCYATHPGHHVPTLNAKSKRALGAKYPGLDIRGDGGYAVFCGSNEKGEYRWLSAEFNDLSALPEDLRHLLGLIPPTAATANGSGHGHYATPATDSAVADIPWLIGQALQRAPREGRDNCGFGLACQLRDNGYNQAEAETAMREYASRVRPTNTKGQSEPYAVDQALRSLRSAYSQAPRAPIVRGHSCNRNSEPSSTTIDHSHESAHIEPKSRLDKEPHIRADPFELTAPSLQARPVAPPPEFFEITEDSIKRYPPGGTKSEVVCGRIDVLAWARDEENQEWGKLLEFRDPEHKAHRFLMPMSLLGKDQSELRSRLLSMGLRMSPKRESAGHLREFLLEANPPVFARTVQRVGWHRNTFVLPDENIGPSDDEEVLFQPAQEMKHLLRVSGSAEDWRAGLGQFCSGNRLLLFGASLGFAAPLLHFTGEGSGVFHLFSETTTGKTSILLVSASVSSSGVDSWLTTSNAIETTAEWHNDCGLYLDELKLIDPEHATKLAYSFSNGQSKSRLDRNIRAHRKAHWRLLVLSTGELSLSAHVAAAVGLGRRLYGGQEIRFCEIPAKVHDEFGSFEELHGFRSSKDFSELLRSNARKFYGAPIRAFLKQLVKKTPEWIIDTIQGQKRSFLVQRVPPGASREVARAADRFALVGAAGELATAFGLTGWQPGASTGAAAKCFEAWRDQRGGNGQWDADQALSAVRQFLIAHGSSRFQLYSPGMTDEESAKTREKIINRIGFKAVERDGTAEYIVQENMFSELCGAYSRDLVISALRKRGALTVSKSEPQRNTVQRRLPEIGKVRVYVINAHVFDDGSESQPEQDGGDTGDSGDTDANSFIV